MAENHPDDTGEETEAKKTGLGRKLLGLFVESEGAGAHAHHPPFADDNVEPTVASKLVVHPAAPSARPVMTPSAAVNPQPMAVPVAAAAQRPEPPASYKVPDFGSIYKTGGMPDDDRDRLQKAEELLRNLPAETPLVLKRQIVDASLRAFGIAPERLVLAATKAITTLDTYFGIGEQDLEQRIAATGKRFAELDAERAKLEAQLAERTRIQQTLSFDVRARQTELRTITEFFGAAPQPSAKG